MARPARPSVREFDTIVDKALLFVFARALDIILMFGGPATGQPLVCNQEETLIVIDPDLRCVTL